MVTSSVVVAPAAKAMSRSFSGASLTWLVETTEAPALTAPGLAILSASVGSAPTRSTRIAGYCARTATGPRADSR
jgi:hypothetical protein